jgi:hypothetical protein
LSRKHGGLDFDQTNWDEVLAQEASARSNRIPGSVVVIR